MSVESTIVPIDDAVVAAVVDPSAAPIRERGLRSRAGNAMGRTRGAVLEGARLAVAAAGARKTTMADIADRSGIAKGTLYNHFRTKEAVFAATVQATIEQLGDDAIAMSATVGLGAALDATAAQLAGDPALVTLRGEPAALLPLISISDTGLWLTARATTAAVLAAAGVAVDDAAVEFVLRWLVSFVASGVDGDRVVGGDLISAGLEISPAGVAGAGRDDHDDQSDRYV